LKTISLTLDTVKQKNYNIFSVTISSTEEAMAELNQQIPNQEQAEQPKKSPRGGVFWVIFSMLIVLILANLDAILKPIKALNDILTPIVIGLVLAYLCSPILRFFEIKVFYRLKRTANRAFSMVCTYIVILLLLAGVALLIIPQLTDSINDFRTNGMFYINRLITSLNGFISSLPFDLPDGAENSISLENLLAGAINLIEQYASNIVGGVGSFAGGALTLLKNIIIGIFVSIYVLFSSDRLKAGCRRIAHALLPEDKERLLIHYTRQAHRKFGGFIVGKMVDSIMVGITCAIFFTIFKIPYPILIATIIGITDFIPFFGPFLGAIPSGVIIFITDPSKLILFVILILVVQQIDGNLLAPLILGDHTGLTSLGVLVAITVMGGLFGFIGMLIGVPLFALLMTILDDMIKTRLRKKNAPTDLYAYYPADAFIRPSDETEARHETLTQKFLRWVAAVEPEMESENYTPGFVRRQINLFRVGCLNTARFFRRLFSTKQLPEDQRSTHAYVVRKRGMTTDRTFARVLILSILTLGIYLLYLTEIMAENTNIACSRDGKRTWGVGPLLLLSIVTLGIFPIIWHCQIIRRFRHCCEKHGVTCRITIKFYLIWTLVGAPIIIGPMIAWARYLKGYNQVCVIFNKTHTFPVSKRTLEEEAAEGAAYLAACKAAKAAEKAALVGGDTTIFGPIVDESSPDDIDVTPLQPDQIPPIPEEAPADPASEQQ